MGNSLITIGAGITGTFCLARVIQPSLVFIPPSHDHDKVDIINGIAYKFVNKKTPDIIIYSHGNSEDICTVDIAEMANSLGCSIVTYDYIGYGQSKGRPSERGCIKALTTIVDHIQTLYPSANIILIGRSLGTGVVTQFAYRRNWTNPIVLLSPFKSIGRVALDNSFTHSMSGMFKTLDIIDKLKCPVKIIHGVLDNLVKCDHGKHLHSLCKSPLSPIWRHCGHNDLPLFKSDITELLTQY